MILRAMVQEQASLKTGFPLGFSPFSSLVLPRELFDVVHSFPYFLTGHVAYLAKTPAPRPISVNCIRQTTPLFPRIAWPDCPPLTARQVNNSNDFCECSECCNFCASHHVLRLSPINTSTMYMYLVLWQLATAPRAALPPGIRLA